MTMVMTKETQKQQIIQDIAALWAPLTDGEKQLLDEFMTVRHFKKNEIIYKEDDDPDHILCLAKGKVKIFKDGIGGRNQIIRVLKPLEFFGYRAAFANECYKTAAMSLEPTVIGMIPIHIMLKLFRGNPAISIFFIRQLSVELGRSDSRIVNLTQKHIRGRLAEALLFLKDNYGVEEDGYTISIYLSREDLANLSNMTTSNAIRTLSTFASERLIATDGRKIKIIDEEKLRKISKMG